MRYVRRNVHRMFPLDIRHALGMPNGERMSIVIIEAENPLKNLSMNWLFRLHP